MNPWLLIVLLVAWVASVTLTGVHEFKAGSDAAEAVWQARAAREAQDAARALADAQASVRQAEADASARLDAISSDYERKLSNAQARHDADVAAAHTGSIVLRDSNGYAPMCPNPGAAAAPALATGRHDDATTGCQLSGEVAGRLLGIADDADTLAGQLAACQAVIRADREVR